MFLMYINLNNILWGWTWNWTWQFHFHFFQEADNFPRINKCLVHLVRLHHARSLLCVWGRVQTCAASDRDRWGAWQWPSSGHVTSWCSGPVLIGAGLMTILLSSEICVRYYRESKRSLDPELDNLTNPQVSSDLNNTGCPKKTTDNVKRLEQKV